MISRTDVEAAATSREIVALNREALPLPADVSNERDAHTVVSEVLHHFGRIDVLVNDAGVLGPIGSLVDNDAQGWVSTILNNLGGTFFCCQAVLPSMIRQKHGKIINLSGGGAVTSRPRFSAYACSKAAIVRLTEILAEELKPYFIEVNAIAPGGVYTRMTEQVILAGDAAGAKELADAYRLKKTQSSPDAAAALAVFLASDASNGLSGRLISATWDDWRSMAHQIENIMASNMYTMRRISPQTEN